MPDLSAWTWAWIGWGLLFAAIELPAVFNKTNNDTLSEQIWWFLSNRAPHTGTRRMFFLSLWAVLTAHFFFKGV